MSWYPALSSIGISTAESLISSTEVRLLATTVSELEFARLVCLSCLGDSTADGDLVFVHAIKKVNELFLPKGSKILTTSEQQQFGGVDLKERKLRKGKADRIQAWLDGTGGTLSAQAKMVLAFPSDQPEIQTFLVADDKMDLGIVQIQRTFISTHSEVRQWVVA